jgi:hypothetical protein
MLDEVPSFPPNNAFSQFPVRAVLPPIIDRTLPMPCFHSGPVQSNRHHWQEIEDESLRDAVFVHGGKRWKLISPCIPTKTRSPVDCRDRWRELQKNLQQNKRLWTKSEDSLLSELVHKNIASYLVGRNGKQCRER